MSKRNKLLTKSHCYTLITILLLLFSVSLISVILLNSNYGSLNVSTVSFPYGNSQLTGFLYRPFDASENNKLPMPGSRSRIIDICLWFAGSQIYRSGINTTSRPNTGNGRNEKRHIYRQTNSITGDSTNARSRSIFPGRQPGARERCYAYGLCSSWRV